MRRIIAVLVLTAAAAASVATSEIPPETREQAVEAGVLPDAAAKR